MIRRLLAVPHTMLGNGRAMERYLRVNGCRPDWKWVSCDHTYEWAMIEVWVTLA